MGYPCDLFHGPAGDALPNEKVVTRKGRPHSQNSSHQYLSSETGVQPSREELSNPCTEYRKVQR